MTTIYLTYAECRQLIVSRSADPTRNVLQKVHLTPKYAEACSGPLGARIIFDPSDRPGSWDSPPGALLPVEALDEVRRPGERLLVDLEGRKATRIRVENENGMVVREIPAPEEDSREFPRMSDIFRSAIEGRQPAERIDVNPEYLVLGLTAIREANVSMARVQIHPSGAHDAVVLRVPGRPGVIREVWTLVMPLVQTDDSPFGPRGWATKLADAPLPTEAT